MFKNMKVKLLITLLIISFFYIFPLSTKANELKCFPNLDSYKETLSVGVLNEEKIDINNDGNDDFLIYTSGGEERYLDILIRKNNHFVLLNIPIGQKYEILRSSNHYELKIGFSTFPNFGDIHGSDKYLWYDFYKIRDSSLILQNSAHVEFYREMIPLYQDRIKELELEISSFEKQKVDNALIQLKKDHIFKYNQLVRKAIELIEN